MNDESRQSSDDSRNSAENTEMVLPDSKNIINTDKPTLIKPPSILKVIGITLLVTIVLFSILLNISLLAGGGSSFYATVPFQWIIIIGALFITALSLAANFWLYYIRSIYVLNGPALVPEKWGMIISKLEKTTINATIKTSESLNSLMKNSDNQAEKSESLLESFLTLQQVISSRDKEIERLKKGYDGKIYKKFLTRFIRVSSALNEIQEEAKSSDQTKNYKYLSRLIQNALEECGVEKISPEINSDYRQLGPEVSDDHEVIYTENKLLDFKIASIESPAYIIEGEGSKEIIIQSKVTIYRAHEPEGASDQ